MVKLMDKPQGGKQQSAPPVAPTRKSAPVPGKGTETERPGKNQEREWPVEGPHARADLINEAATPGSGLFSGKAKPGGKVDPGAG
jgi:hypothetical protein